MGGGGVRRLRPMLDTPLVMNPTPMTTYSVTEHAESSEWQMQWAITEENCMLSSYWSDLC